MIKQAVETRLKSALEKIAFNESIDQLTTALQEYERLAKIQAVSYAVSKEINELENLLKLVQLKLDDLIEQSIIWEKGI